MLKIKDGLEFYAIEGDLFHVYDEANGRHFKLGRQEVEWLRLLDGSRSPEQLVGLIPFEYFQRFMTAVTRMGLLETGASKPKFNPLKIKLLNVAPGRVVDRYPAFARGYREFLAWGTLPLFAINVLLAAALVPVATPVLNDFQPQLALLPFYFVAIVLIGLIHELSHTFVARSYGVAVPRIGFMLFFLHPAFYADVSAINMLGDRRQRLRTLFAGIQANNVLVTAALVTAVLSIGTPVFTYALLFAMMNAILIGVNLVPFVEYDGYYILQELLGEPNFNRHSFANTFGAEKKRAEYGLYMFFSQAFQVGLVISLLIVLRLAVNQFWDGLIVDLLFLGLIVASIPGLAHLRLKAMK